MLKDYLEQKDKMPPLCPEEERDAVKSLILDKLNSGELIYLSTISPTGWPITDCMHFSVIQGKNKVPVIYMFTHENVRKLENIAINNRVSVSVCHTVSYERRNETWSFQFMGIASIITDEKEIEQAILATRAKKGYEFTTYLPLEKQPCIKVEPVFGTFMSGGEKMVSYSIDYLL